MSISKNKNLVKVRNLKKIFEIKDAALRKRSIKAVDGVSFEIKKKDVLTGKLPSKGIEDWVIRFSLGLLRILNLNDKLIAIGVKIKLIKNDDKMIFKCSISKYNSFS